MIENQKSVAHWAFMTFGAATDVRAAIRANEEMAELLRTMVDGNYPKACEEIADVVICLYRLAENIGIDVHNEVNRKMAKNRKRKWKVDGTGCGYHR